ncbi:MAG: RluA family pseudouridine synthase [Myxococcales bacterium FL481]|nr:MAG: RluA family pseudouridine synthase [Myxococcales bacterium FL481]
MTSLATATGADGATGSVEAAESEGVALPEDLVPAGEAGADWIEIPLAVDVSHHGFRLDRFLSSRFGRLSRSRIHKMIALGRVLDAASNRPWGKPASRVRTGDELLIVRPAPVEPAVVREYEELHRDSAFLVLNKPAGLPVHPSARYHRNTLTAVMRERMGAGHGWEMGHRLDRETSGVLVLAQRGEAARRLKHAFFRRRTDKEYLAVVHGELTSTHRIEIPLGPARGSRIRIKVGERSLDDGGLSALTEVEPLQRGSFRGEPVTLVRARPKTGRTHQIRVHLALVGHAVVGDKVYGLDEQRFLDVVEDGRPITELEAELGLSRHALHAHRLTLPHPASGEPVTFCAPWPDELAQVLEFDPSRGSN